MGRPPLDIKQLNSRYPVGTRERIDAVLKPGEKQADFLRQAVEELLRKRERVKRRKE
jgi:hypothetical protein